MGTYVHPIIQTIKKQINGGTVLLASTALALIIANSPLKGLYFAFFEETVISIDFHFWQLHKNLHHWINDGLMAIFFFHIGLEIKRELYIGELSTVKKAMVPFIAAFGGMLLPALIFFGINQSSAEYSSGWAIPMATDIAFALGILALLGKRVPVEIKILLTSLAIADDLGAVITIAIFYTDTIIWSYLLFSMGAWAVLYALNRLGLRIYWIFILGGILLVWYPMLKSGVHATVAGVLLAFTIPIDRKFNAKVFIESTRDSLRNFMLHSKEDHTQVILTPEQYSSLESIRDHCEKAESPLQRLEHSLHSFSVYLIMPIFAFANTGIDFGTINIAESLQSTLLLGIVAGLVVGKAVGIAGALWIFVKLKIIAPPSNAAKHQILGASFLAGIGFTMSIFISDLAFADQAVANQAKLAVFIASIIAGSIGYFLLRSSKGIFRWRDKQFWDLRS